MVSAALTASLGKLNQSLSARRHKSLKQLTADRLTTLANIKASLRQSSPQTADAADDDSSMIALQNQLEGLGAAMLEPFKQALGLGPQQAKLCVITLDLLGSKLAQTSFFYWRDTNDQQLSECLVEFVADVLANRTEDSTILLAVARLYRNLFCGCPHLSTRCITRKPLGVIMQFLFRLQLSTVPALQKYADQALREITECAMEGFWRSFDTISDQSTMQTDSTCTPSSRQSISSKTLSSALRNSADVTANILVLIDILTVFSDSLSKTGSDANTQRLLRCNLEMVNLIFDSCSPVLKHTKACLNLIENRVSFELYRLMCLSNTKIVHLAISLFCKLIVEFKRNLTEHRGFYLEHVFLKLFLISPVETQLVLIKSMYKVMISDRRCFERVFLMHDCSLSGTSTIQNLIEELCALTVTGLASNQQAPVNSWTTAVTGAASGWLNQSTVNTDVRSHLANFLAAFMHTMRTWLAAGDLLVEQRAPNSDSHSISPSVMGEISILETQVPAWFYNARQSQQDNRITVRERVADKNLIQSILQKTFAHNPSAALAQLQEAKLLNTDVTSVAAFLMQYPGLSKQAVGIYLSENAPFNKECLAIVLGSLEFSGLPIDAAIPLFLTVFRLPGEAQKIDRIVEMFAKCYVRDNPGFLGTLENQIEPVTADEPEEASTPPSKAARPISESIVPITSNPEECEDQSDTPSPQARADTLCAESALSGRDVEDFANMLTSEKRRPSESLPAYPRPSETKQEPLSTEQLADLAYIISFSTIMLHTDAHSKEIRPENRLSMENFVRNTQACDGGHLIPTSYLEDLYTRITQNEWTSDYKGIISQGLPRVVNNTEALWQELREKLKLLNISSGGRRLITTTSEACASPPPVPSETSPDRLSRSETVTLGRYGSPFSLRASHSISRDGVGITLVDPGGECVSCATIRTLPTIIQTMTVRALKPDVISQDLLRSFPNLGIVTEYIRKSWRLEPQEPNELSNLIHHQIVIEGLNSALDTSQPTFQSQPEVALAGIREAALGTLDACGSICISLKEPKLFHQVLVAMAVTSGLLLGNQPHPFHSLALASWRRLFGLISSWIQGVSDMWSIIGICISEIERYQLIYSRKTQIKCLINSSTAITAYNALLPPSFPLLETRNNSNSGTKPVLSTIWQSILKHIDSSRELWQSGTGDNVTASNLIGSSTPGPLTSSGLYAEFAERLQGSDLLLLFETLCLVSYCEINAFHKNQYRVNGVNLQGRRSGSGGSSTTNLGSVISTIEAATSGECIRTSSLHRLLDLLEHAILRQQPGKASLIGRKLSSSIRSSKHIGALHNKPVPNASSSDAVSLASVLIRKLMYDHLIKLAETHLDTNIQVYVIDILKLAINACLDSGLSFDQREVLGSLLQIFNGGADQPDGSGASEVRREVVISVITNIIKTRGMRINRHGWAVILELLSEGVPTISEIHLYDWRDTVYSTRERLTSGCKILDYSCQNHLGQLLPSFDKLVRTLLSYVKCCIPAGGVGSTLNVSPINLKVTTDAMNLLTALSCLVCGNPSKRKPIKLIAPTPSLTPAPSAGTSTEVVTAAATPQGNSLGNYDEGLNRDLVNISPLWNPPNEPIMLSQCPDPLGIDDETLLFRTIYHTLAKAHRRLDISCPPASMSEQKVVMPRPNNDPVDTGVIEILSERDSEISHAGIIMVSQASEQFSAEDESRLSVDESGAFRPAHAETMLSITEEQLIGFSVEADFDLYWQVYVTPLLKAFADIITSSALTLELRRRSEDACFQMLGHLADLGMTAKSWSKVISMTLIPIFTSLLNRVTVKTEPLLDIGKWFVANAQHLEFSTKGDDSYLDNTTDKGSTNWASKVVITMYRNFCALVFSSAYASKSNPFTTALLYCCGLYYSQENESCARVGDALFRTLGSYAASFTPSQWRLYVDFIIYVLRGVEPIELLHPAHESSDLDVQKTVAKSVVQALLINDSRLILTVHTPIIPLATLYDWLDQLEQMYLFARNFDSQPQHRRMLHQRGFMGSSNNLPSLGKQERDITSLIVTVLCSIAGCQQNLTIQAENAILQPFLSARASAAATHTPNAYELILDSSRVPYERMTPNLTEFINYGTKSFQALIAAEEDEGISIVLLSAGRALLQVLQSQTQRYYCSLFGMSELLNSESQLSAEFERELSGLNKMFEENILNKLLDLPETFYTIFSVEMYQLCADWTGLQPFQLRMMTREIMRRKLTCLLSQGLAGG